MANIGPERREIIVEPLEEEEPMEAPAEEPVEAPKRELVPA